MAARSQPGNDPLRADLLARMVALPDPGRGQRVLQSVGSIAVIVLLAIVCVYAQCGDLKILMMRSGDFSGWKILVFGCAFWSASFSRREVTTRVEGR